MHEWQWVVTIAIFGLGVTFNAGVVWVTQRFFGERLNTLSERSHDHGNLLSSHEARLDAHDEEISRLWKPQPGRE